MGAIESSNNISSELFTDIDAIGKVGADAQSSCTSQISQLFENCHDLENVNFEVEDICVIDTKQMADSMIDSKIDSSVDVAMDQVAKAIGQNFSLNPGSISAKNALSTVVDSKQSIRDTISQRCSTAVQSSTEQICRNSGKWSGVTVSAKTLHHGIQKCLQDSGITNNVKSKIEEKLKQTATAKQENALGMILFAIAAIMLSLVLLLSTVSGVIVPVGLFLLFVTLIVVLLTLLVSRPRFYRSGCGDCSRFGKKDDCDVHEPMCTWKQDKCTCNSNDFPQQCSLQCSNFKSRDHCHKAGCSFVDDRCVADENCDCASTGGACSVPPNEIFAS